MARKFQIKRGLKANLPTLAQGELAMTTDSGNEGLHLGNGEKNMEVPILVNGSKMNLNNKAAAVSANNGRVVLNTYKTPGSTVAYRSLMVRNQTEVESLAHAFCVAVNDGNGETPYALYGEHNKPSPTELGAEPADGFGWLANGTDLATMYGKNGWYMLAADYTYVNSPESGVWGILTVKDKTATLQIINGHMYYAGNLATNPVLWSKIYSTYNKPTAADVGAATTSAVQTAQTTADNAQNVANRLSRLHAGLGNEYVWDKCIPNFKYTEKVAVAGGNVSLVFTGSGSSATFRISNTLQEALVGVYTEQVVTPANRTSLNGKYVRTDAVQYNNQPFAYANVFYIAPNTTWSIYTNPNGYSYGTGTVYADISSDPIHQEYVNSPDPSAYPPTVLDGYTYTPLGQLGAAFDGAKIEIGSYVGTGGGGASQPCSLTFSFEPKVVIILYDGSDYCINQATSNPASLILVKGMVSTPPESTGTNRKCCVPTFNGNSVSWYHADGAMYQMNSAPVSGRVQGVYHYIAFG